MELRSNLRSLNVTVRSLSTSMFEHEVKLAFIILLYRTIMTSNNCGIHLSSTITSVYGILCVHPYIHASVSVRVCVCACVCMYLYVRVVQGHAPQDFFGKYILKGIESVYKRHPVTKFEHSVHIASKCRRTKI